MNYKGLIGIAVFLCIALLGIISGVIVAIVALSRRDFGVLEKGYLYTQPSDDNYYLQADIGYFEIRCAGSAVPSSDEVDWNLKWRDPRGHYVPEGFNNKPRVVSTEKNSLTLKFTKPTVNDSGVYVCSGFYDQMYTQAVSIHFVEGVVTPSFDDRPPSIHVKNQTVVAHAGTNMTLPCFADGAEPITFDWYNLQNELVTDDNSSSIYYKMDGKISYLTLLFLETNQAGVYRCVARNDFGEDTKLYNVLIPAEDAPTFNSTYENVTVEERSKLELFCCADNDNGTTKYTWYDQYNRTVTSNQDSAVYISTTLKGAVLTINAVESKHSGVYECRAKNQQGFDKKLYDISVSSVSQGIPSFDDDYQYVLAEEGSILKLQCSASGEGPITYKWYNQRDEGIQFSGNGPVNISTSDNASVLVIKNVQFNHKDTYTCRAQNQLGANSKAFNISVYRSSGTDEDEPSIRHVEVRKVTTSSVLFSIAISGAVDEIEVKYSEIQNKTEHTVSFKTGEEYEVKDLVAGGFYNFSFRISSSTNTPWLEVHNVTLLPRKPHVIIRSMDADKLAFEFFTTVDERMRGTLIKYEISYYTVQIQSGTYWEPSACGVTINLPYCQGYGYTITGLSSKIYYELKIRAFTEAGFSEPYTNKFYIP